MAPARLQPVGRLWPPCSDRQKAPSFHLLFVQLVPQTLALLLPFNRVILRHTYASPAASRPPSEHRTQLTAQCCPLAMRARQPNSATLLLLLNDMHSLSPQVAVQLPNVVLL